MGRRRHWGWEYEGVLAWTVPGKSMFSTAVK